ncbi:MAG: YbgC/FadM family acyl-CoA thioesterase [Burkholderiaceae bacterium]|nr:YbgC/FadM family acyl-CoA thioesterase [Burkholderiaceae bacterium]
MNRADFRFADRLRVRWAEVDMQKIVFNGHYLMYFDTAVAGWWRAMGLPYEQTMHDLGGDFYVRKATVEYEGSARYDDQLEVGVRCERIGTSSMRLQAAAFRGGERLVTGELVYVWADPATQRAQPVPQPLRELFLGFEAGEPVLDVQLGSWDTLGAQARPIRDAVFVGEQGVPAELEHDAADASALHALAVNRLGRAVATGRLLEHAAGVSKIGRMAVLAALRGGGTGSAVLRALVDAARARGDRELLLHAQASAVGFYRRHGFVPVGPGFQEAGIAHQAMVMAL